jgi:glucose/arabinose dehydrogenase
MSFVRRLLAASILVFVAVAAPAHGQEILRLKLVTDQIQKPVYVAAPPGDTGRLFIIEQYRNDDIGRVRIVRRGTLLSQPFLEIDNLATNWSGGLFCIAFHPDFADNGYVFVKYKSASGDVRVVRYTASADPDVADPATAQSVLTITHPGDAHNGGWIGFGPDGYLYISSGDGGGANDTDRNGQDTSVLLGKMLRVDVNGDAFPADANRNYAVPPSNPFVGIPGADEIWAYGLREPWRCSFDRETGDLYIADVGQEQREELNVQPAASLGGENYGWRCVEGTLPLFGDPECSGPQFVEPVLDYQINLVDECTIIGGYVYRGSAIPELRGKYVYADFCTSRIWSLRYDGAAITDVVEHAPPIVDQPGMTLAQITSFGEDACGELYLTAHDGQVFRIETAHPEPSCEKPVDFDTDTDIDLVDFANFSRCYAGANAPPSIHCPDGVDADFDADGDVDLADFDIFTRRYTGAG